MHRNTFTLWQAGVITAVDVDDAYRKLNALRSIYREENDSKRIWAYCFSDPNATFAQELADFIEFQLGEDPLAADAIY